MVTNAKKIKARSYGEPKNSVGKEEEEEEEKKMKQVWTYEWLQIKHKSA